MIDYAKELDKWEWAPFFTVKEFTCKGSGKCLMDADFMQRLYQLRDEYGKPMHVTSGYRSPEHNMEVSDTGAGGPHTTGKAVDISISGPDAYSLLALALKHGFTGIGVKQAGPFTGRFLHIDTITTPPRPNIWSYNA